MEGTEVGMKITRLIIDLLALPALLIFAVVVVAGEFTMSLFLGSGDVGKAR